MCIAEHELEGIQGRFLEGAVRDSEAHGEAFEQLRRGVGAKE